MYKASGTDKSSCVSIDMSGLGSGVHSLLLQKATISQNPAEELATNRADGNHLQSAHLLRYNAAEERVLGATSKDSNDHSNSNSTLYYSARADSSDRGHKHRDRGHEHRDRGYENHNRGYEPHNRGHEPRDRGYEHHDRGYEYQGGYENRDRGYQHQGGYENRDRGHEHHDRGYGDRGHDQHSSHQSGDEIDGLRWRENMTEYVGRPLRGYVEGEMYQPYARPFRGPIQSLCNLFDPEIKTNDNWHLEGSSCSTNGNDSSAPPVPPHKTPLGQGAGGGQGAGAGGGQGVGAGGGQGVGGGVVNKPLPPPPKNTGCCSTGACCGLPFSMKKIPGMKYFKRAFATPTGAAIVGGAGLVIFLKSGAPGSTALAGFLGVASTITAKAGINGDGNTAVGIGTNALISVNTVNRWGQAIYSSAPQWTEIQRSCLQSGIVYKDAADGALYAWSIRQRGLVCLEDIPSSGVKGYCKKMKRLLDDREESMKPILSGGPQLQGFSDDDYVAFNRLLLTGALLIYTNGGQLLSLAGTLAQGVGHLASRGGECAGDAIDAGTLHFYTLVSAPICAAIRNYFSGDKNNERNS